MSGWHKKRYGDPCEQCGHDWPPTLDGCVALTAGAPAKYASLLEGTDGSARHPALGWSAAGYVCHVTDNLRIWAERLACAALGGASEIEVYDGEALAGARRYERVPVEGALWSMARAVDDWSDAVGLAEDAAVVLMHPERGALSVFDVASGNTHDVVHHAWDIRRTLEHDNP